LVLPSLFSPGKVVFSGEFEMAGIQPWIMVIGFKSMVATVFINDITRNGVVYVAGE
jgi:hypothetical protein